MPMDFRYDQEKEALFGTLNDPFTLQEYRSSIEAIVQSKEFPPDIRTLWDLRGLGFKAIDRNFEEHLISISEQFPERGSAKVALIVQSDLGFGMTRMFEILAEKLGYQTMVFRSYTEGEKWLLQE